MSGIYMMVAAQRHSIRSSQEMLFVISDHMMQPSARRSSGVARKLQSCSHVQVLVTLQLRRSDGCASRGDGSGLRLAVHHLVFCVASLGYDHLLHLSLQRRSLRKNSKEIGVGCPESTLRMQTHKMNWGWPPLTSLVRWRAMASRRTWLSC